MIANYDGNSDLNVNIYRQDIPYLIKGYALKTETNNKNRFNNKFLIKVSLSDKLSRIMEVKQNNIQQLKFQFNKPQTIDNNGFYLEEYKNHPEILKIIGWDFLLNKTKFLENILITSKNPLTEACPFWARGLQYHCNIDRIHLTYWHE